MDEKETNQRLYCKKCGAWIPDRLFEWDDETGWNEKGIQTRLQEVLGLEVINGKLYGSDMDNEKEKVYCKDCKNLLQDNITIASYQRWGHYKLVISTDRGKGNDCVACLYPVGTEDTPILQKTICGDLSKLNANNDCPHFKKKKARLEKPAAEPKRPWWKFWR